MIALKELVQAAGLAHPSEISALHIVHRTADLEVKLLANVLPYLKPGALLAAMRGEADWPHNVYRIYWHLARSDSFAVAPADERMALRGDAASMVTVATL